AERLVFATCGPDPNRADLPVEDEAPDFIVVGKVRTQGATQGKVVDTVAAPPEPVPNSGFLREAFYATIKPYLEQGAAIASPLAAPTRASAVFSELRVRVDPRAHPTVEVIEGLCEQRRQMDRQQVLQFWLHNWLLVHLPLTAALMVLMIAHTVVAL